MEFDEYMIINGNAMNKEKIFVGTRNMQEFSKMNLARRGMYNRMTYVTYPHTCTTCLVNLVFAMIFLTKGHLLKFSREVVGSTTVKIPISINAI